MALAKPRLVDAGGLNPADHAHAHAHETGAPHGGRYGDILDAIGHTPLVEIPRMSPNPAVRIFAKLEMANPTGSVKDRVAKYLVEDLEARGLLHADSIIL
ncbi:MAG TPA: pyridoxal-phosphate dependent enzyme, partial [Candidatus Limnocylindrales bacterium]